ncbi:hypothetical protein IMSHALPRED_005143 [Imshaugia aleurites]|uniref:Uncharacterized protein n=1 Tax=Imshaugia aleurites TaxID=172621 RepID=A0A8H3FG57_9LECA|nr:hypothetical protein IMSHALPRED_005143 [Imshaugia aleurites]
MAPLTFLAFSVLILLPSFSQADYSPPICPPPPAPQIFGHPTYNNCRSLIEYLRLRDRLLHLFIPPGLPRPTTHDQIPGVVTDYVWRNRVDLPILLATAGCKLAVISRIQADGSQGWGMSWYGSLANALDDLNFACVSPYAYAGGNRGGYKRCNTTSNLVVVLYQPGSDSDEYVTAEVAAGRQPVADRDGVPFTAPDPSAQNSPEGPLDDTATSSLRAPNPQQVAGRTCGQYCSSDSLCTGDDGCKCIADPWQSPGSGYFTGACKLPYLDSGRRLSEIYVNSTALVNVTGAGWCTRRRI